MKRKHQKERKKESELIPLPKELIGEIATHFRPTTIGDVVKFSLICKTAFDKIDLFLGKWLDSIFHASQRLGVCWVNLEKYLKRAQFRGDIDQIWEREKEREGGPRSEFLLNCFELVKEAMYDYCELRDTTPQEKYICRPFGHDSHAKICDLFYFDYKNDKIIPLHEIPNLVAMMEVKKIRVEYTKLLEQNTMPSIVGLALVGLKKKNDCEVKSFYWEMRKELGKPLSIVKNLPKKTLVSNILLGEKHLFSHSEETEVILKNLFHYQSKLSMEKRVSHVYKFITKEARQKRLIDGLGPLEKPPSYMQAFVVRIRV